MIRDRLAPGIATLVTIALGLGVRSAAVRPRLPAPVDAFAGDTLWGAMVLFLFATLFPRCGRGALAVAALLFAWSIEASQLYHAPWIDRVRANPLGHLVLGEGFLWSDLVCYTVGIALAASVLRAISGRPDRAGTSSVPERR